MKRISRVGCVVSDNLKIVGYVTLVCGVVCACGAVFANVYPEEYNSGLSIGPITRYPYQQYVFPLAFLAVLFLVVAIVITIVVSLRLRTENAKAKKNDPSYELL